MKIRNGYTFDDVLLIPKFSKISSRNDIDTSVDLGRGIKLKIPIISANMKHVTGVKMARTISKLGGLALLHRFDDRETLINNYIAATSDNEFRDNVGVSIGVKVDVDYSLAVDFYDAGARVFCIDVAHGHHELAGKMTEMIRAISVNILVISGNVATYKGAKYLYEHGADVIKCGVGNGSSCSTRIETGNGIPQLTALSEICENCKDDFKIISDGGIQRAGDITKSLCFSSCVMIGNLLAGTSDSPGDIFTIDGKSYKEYAGSSTFNSSHVEGVSGLVKYKGDTLFVINKLMEGLRSGMSYQGVDNLDDLRKNPEFISISHAGLIESNPHDIWIR